MKYPRVNLITDDESEDGVIEVKESDLVMGKDLVEYLTELMQIRGIGDLRDKSIYLSDLYDYNICRDNVGKLCLLVLKK